MRFLYEPFVLRRFADGRVLFVNPRMPFESFIHCFQAEHPFFLISQLDDGRLAITPNTMFLPWNVLQGGVGLLDLLPNDIEYVTLRNATYPLIITAHPINNLDVWFKKFERLVVPFANQTLSEFVGGVGDFLPLKPDMTSKKFVKAWPQQEIAEPVTR